MQDINTLVTFSSRTGETEKLALAGGLGAVQARSFIRLRWLRENVDDPTLDTDPAWKENRERMAKEYIPPREVDFEWADLLVIALPARAALSCPELTAYLDALQALQSSGKLRGKAVTAFTTGSMAPTALYAALASLDLVVIPPDLSANGNAADRARLQVSRATQAARALKRMPA